MAFTSNLFENVWDQALATPINYPSDDIRMALLTPSAAPNLGTWIHYSDVANEVAAGGGYTAGGVALASKTHVVTLANSWPATWAASTAYAYGQIVRPSTGNGFLYTTQDPALPLFDWIDPTGTKRTITGLGTVVNGVQIVLDTPGEYHAALPASLEGFWSYRGYGQDGSGNPVASSDKQTFVIVPFSE